MKALSLLQPWATLVVIGAKQFETRSWRPKDKGIIKQVYDEGILIHASKKMSKEQRELCNTEPFASALSEIDELPLGKIIGHTMVCGYYSTNDASLEKLIDKWTSNLTAEKAFGNYSPDRYAWMLSTPSKFSHEVSFPGSLNLWDFDTRICTVCGCTDLNCSNCIKKSEQPCHWIEKNLCSACSSLRCKKDGNG